MFDRPWPGIMRTVYGDQDRFEKTYFSRFPGYYSTCQVTEPSGTRADTSGSRGGLTTCSTALPGHLMSTAQVESVLVEHKMVAEAVLVQVRWCLITSR